MRDNDSNTMFAGGIIVVIIVIMACLKAIERIFIQLGKTFAAFGKMAESFFYMAWHGVLVLGLIALGLGCVFAAVYFTYKYFLMVKRATEVQTYVEDKIQDVVRQVNLILREARESADEKISALEYKLSEALDKPALAPVPVDENLLPEPTDKTSPEAHDPSEPTDSSPTVQNSSPQNVDNPF